MNGAGGVYSPSLKNSGFLGSRYGFQSKASEFELVVVGCGAGAGLVSGVSIALEGALFSFQ